MPTSRTMRATLAMMRADSIRNTASTASVVAVGVCLTPTDQSNSPSGGTASEGRDHISVFSRSSAVSFQLFGWISRKRLVHSMASALSLACMMA